jgi:hypothetical protein
MLNLSPSTFEYEARVATWFFSDGSADVAATIDRIVAIFMVESMMLCDSAQKATGNQKAL